MARPCTYSRVKQVKLPSQTSKPTLEKGEKKVDSKMKKGT